MLPSSEVGDPAAGQLPPHPPLSPATGERIKVRGMNARAILHYLCRLQ
jgi:hypothetical protein